MFSGAWRQALRKLEACTVLHSTLARNGGISGHESGAFRQMAGCVGDKFLQPVSRRLPAGGECGVPRSAARCSCMQSVRCASSEKEGGLSKQDEDPFDPLTDRIPEKPVSVAEGASYSIVILAGLAVAGAAAYAVFKELVFQPKEYKIFGKALERVQKDQQVTVRLGSPITGYGQESRNRAARQRIANRTWTDEDGVERCEVVFFIRGPQGAGKVHSEMFKDKADRSWKFTYLIVDVTNPHPTRLMLESYIPNMPTVNAAA